VLAKCVMQRDPDVSETDATRVGLRSLFSVLADFHTDALRRVTGADLPATNIDQPEVAEALADAMGERPLISSLRRFAEAEANLARNAHVELTLETLFIKLSALSFQPCLPDR
jgi:uncharacterized caspase-like protein